MIDGQVGAARRPEIPMLRSYRLWFEHARNGELTPILSEAGHLHTAVCSAPDGRSASTAAGRVSA